jgi:hypothetical protein
MLHGCRLPHGCFEIQAWRAPDFYAPLQVVSRLVVSWSRQISYGVLLGWHMLPDVYLPYAMRTWLGRLSVG